MTTQNGGARTMDGGKEERLTREQPAAKERSRAAE
jgi:hypothetical protein